MTLARRTTLPLASLCAAAVLVAGCGGTANDDYKAKVEQAAKRFQADSARAGQQVSAARTPAQFKAAAGRFGVAVDTFTITLRGLRPPSSVKDEQDRLVADLTRFQRTTTQLAAVTGARDFKALARLGPQLQADIQKVTADAKSLQDAVDKS
jgi:predicted lipid-binding transport protein (Tim44 family)